MKPIRYTLNIYESGSNRYVTGKYESSSPFVAIREGDYLHPFLSSSGEYPESGWPELGPGKYLRATEVHHVLHEPEGKDHITQIVNVYTEVYETN